MVTPSPTTENPTSPLSLQSPLSPASPHSQASSSSYPLPPNYSHRNSGSQRPLPPSDRPIPPKGRTHQSHNGGSKLMKGLRKNKERDRDKQSQSTGDIEEDWTLEGIPPPSSYDGHGINNGEVLEKRRASSDTAQTDSASGLYHDYYGQGDSQIPQKDEMDKKEKKSKSRGIVKKTSRLFARDKDKDKSTSPDYEHSHGPASSSLNPIPTSRQTSYSSAHSSDSQMTTGTSNSIRNHSATNQFPTLTRPISNQSRMKSPREYQSHSRRASQDSTSASSWRARSIRSGSSPHEYQSGGDIGVPIPSRQGSSLSASVPGLSRNSLPQANPIPGNSNQLPSSINSRSPETFPSRMSTWFSHLLPSTSTTTIQEGSSSSSPPQSASIVDSPPPLPPSPLRKPPSAAASFLNAARQRAVDGVRHLLDSEAQPDKCQDAIWVMGVGHSGWRPSTPSRSPNSINLPELSDSGLNGGEAGDRRGSSDSSVTSPTSKNDSGVLRPAAWSRRQKDQTSINSSNPSSTPPSKGFSNLFTASTLSLALPASMTTGSPSKDGSSGVPESPGKSRKDKKEKEIIRWPEQFYDDFRSVVWCTYRSQYAPILSLPNNQLIPSPEAYYSAFGSPADSSTDPSAAALSSAAIAGGISTRPSGTGWSWSRSEGGLTSDAGWGCMLRTGQSMLANALIHLHLGREWRLPSKPSLSPSTQSDLVDLQHYAEYVKIISWFLDDPSPLCPFSVHRMALIGKELGKEVGEWFGPSTAAGALKTLTNSFAPCGLAVSTATDSIIYKSEVYQASNMPSTGWDIASKNGEREIPVLRRSSGSTGKSATVWGGKAVLILVGIRLGLDGVNPIYYESIKALFTFPQSVGIAGGRPSSSYYFVGSQANSLFYLDPHFTRPAIPLEIPPAPTSASTSRSEPTQSQEDEEPVVGNPSEGIAVSEDVKYKLDVVDVDDISSEESSDSDVSSSPSSRIKKSRRTSKQAKRLPAKGTTPPRPGQSSTTAVSETRMDTQLTATPALSASHNSPIPTIPQPHHPLDTLPVNPEVRWWVDAYPEQALKTFHCEKVKKMPLSGLDPSMLLGFLIKNQNDWDDFVERANKLPHKIFSIQDEPPSWDADSDAGLESVSEPDEPGLDDEEIEDVSITSNRQPPHSRTLASSSHCLPKQIKHLDMEGSDDDEEDGNMTSNTTVKAVDIITDKTKGINIRRGAEDEDEEEEWTEGGTPSSQKPILVERPTPTSASRQGTWPRSYDVPHSQKSEPDKEIKPTRQEKGIPFPHNPTIPFNEKNQKNNNDNDVNVNVKIKSQPQPKRPLLDEQRKRTESWFDPSPVKGEAPNGDNLL